MINKINLDGIDYDLGGSISKKVEADLDYFSNLIVELNNTIVSPTEASFNISRKGNVFDFDIYVGLNELYETNETSDFTRIYIKNLKVLFDELEIFPKFHSAYILISDDNGYFSPAEFQIKPFIFSEENIVDVNFRIAMQDKNVNHSGYIYLKTLLILEEEVTNND